MRSTVAGVAVIHIYYGLERANIGCGEVDSEGKRSPIKILQHIKVYYGNYMKIFISVLPRVFTIIHICSVSIVCL